MKSFILEVHDVNPYYRKELFKIVDLFEFFKINKFSLLVVPYFWEDYPLREDSFLIDFIKNLDAEVILHGYTHKGKTCKLQIFWTSGEGEFGGLLPEETFLRIYQSFYEMHSLGFKCDFFIPPAWIGNPYWEEFLVNLGFKGTAYRWFIKFFNPYRKIFSPVLGFSNRYGFSYLSIKGLKFWEKINVFSKVLRVAIHCADFRDERKIFFWQNFLASIIQKRRLINYGELFSKS